MIKKLILGILGLAVLAGAALLASGLGWLGAHEGPGEIRGPERPRASVAAATSRQREAAGADADKLILFGDLHVHTTMSADAFMLSLPLTQGEGAHPPADACDFARFCSALDFWSINDHAEGLTPRHWRETVDSIRQCNAVTDPSEPDTVAFLGWEWTQVGTTPADHYGHKNVVLAGLSDDEIPARPIASVGRAQAAMRSPGPLAIGLLAFAAGGGRMHDYARFLAERRRNEQCPVDVPVRSLPDECVESVATPGELFDRLDEWGVEALVIPHGTTWGFYTPPGSSWDKQLTPAQHDPKRQTLVEIFSGHGNSEQYRAWRAVVFDAEGEPGCPQPTSDYLPSCWRAGEIVRERCEKAGIGTDECERRAATARLNAARAAVAGHLTVPGAQADDWLDSGQCRDCFKPAFNYRPASSVQYMLSLRDFDADDPADRFRFGFISSSDNHFARPGTGYKQVHRTGMTESRDMVREVPAFIRPPASEPAPESVPFDPASTDLQGFQLVELERQASFFMPGGLAAVHSEGRTREQIWAALERKEVYGTSGPRILLWFELSNPPGGGAPLPMGASTRLAETPRFRVRAVGSFEQDPGCPDDATTALSPERLARLCKGECYNPGDARRPITRIEVVRIRPRATPGEDVGTLIEDPWRVHVCPGDSAGCEWTFEDPDFATGARDVAYYVRAIEAPSPAINADNLRCTYDDEGRCVAVDRCGTAETVGDDCLAEAEERAWSSPIFVDWAGARTAAR